MNLSTEEFDEDFIAASNISFLNAELSRFGSTDMDTSFAKANKKYLKTSPSSLIQPISPCSSPMLQVKEEVKQEKNADHFQLHSKRSTTLSMATTCFIDESLTSLDWLIELDINQLTTVPQPCQRGGACTADEHFSFLRDEACSCDDYNCDYDDRSPEWPSSNPRHYSGLPKKPGYSYPELIFMAMQEAPDKQITVAGIYTWIKEKFPYYRNHSNKTWQNSVRHCLSLNSCFQRVNGSKEQSGKGAWRLSPEFLSSKRLKLEDMLKKSNKFMLEQNGSGGGGRVRSSNDFQSRSFHHPYRPSSQSLVPRVRPVTIKLSPKKETNRKNFGSTDSGLSLTLSSSSSKVYCKEMANKAGSVSSSPLSSSADDTCIFDGVVDSFDYTSGGNADFNVIMEYNEKTDLKLLSEFLVISQEHPSSSPSAYLDDYHVHHQDVQRESHLTDIDDHHSDSNSDDVMSMMMMGVEGCQDFLSDANMIDLNLALGNSSAPDSQNEHRCNIFDSPSAASSNPGQGHDLSVNASALFDMENCDLEGFVSNCLTNL